MAGATLKGRSKIKGGVAAHNEVEVINGALKVKVVPRGTAREGYGSAQLKGGVASHGEIEILNGALKVRTS
jgi:uncharacterized protein YaiE (UPF0345 family)